MRHAPATEITNEELDLAIKHQCTWNEADRIAAALKISRKRLTWILADLSVHPNGYVYHRHDGRMIGKGATAIEAIDSAMQHESEVKP